MIMASFSGIFTWSESFSVMSYWLEKYLSWFVGTIFIFVWLFVLYRFDIFFKTSNLSIHHKISFISKTNHNFLNLETFLLNKPNGNQNHFDICNKILKTEQKPTSQSLRVTQRETLLHLREGNKRLGTCSEQPQVCLIGWGFIHNGDDTISLLRS